MSDLQPVPFFDLARLLEPLRPALHDALERCLRHGTFVLGPEVQQFEGQLAAYLGLPHAIGVSSGTDALLATFLALQHPDCGFAPLQPGDEVLTTAFSFISSATSILRAGLRPVFADVAPWQLHPQVEQFERMRTPRTRAVLAVHLFGEPLDLAPLKAWCDLHGLLLVEDCAQSIGARLADGRSVGSAGAAGCFSFFPAKNLGALGDGGAVVTDHALLAARVREKRQHGQAQRYQFEHLGGNFRLDALQAAFLGVLLPQLPEFLRERRKIAQGYLQAFAPLAAAQPNRLRLPVDSAGHAWNQFVLRSSVRDHLRQTLQAQGIPTQVYYPSALHTQGALRDAQPVHELPEAEKACGEVLALPIAPGLTSADQDRVIAAVQSALA